MAVLVQVLATFLLGISGMNVAINMVWPSSTTLLFKSENTTLHRPMGSVEVGLLGSLPACGSFLAFPLLVGSVLDRLGRKRTLILTSFMLMVTWCIRAFANRVEVILFAAFLSGCGSVLFLVAVIYISEIAQDSIRGTLTSLLNQFSSLGLIIAYLLSGIFEYNTIVYTYLSLSIIGVFIIAVLKEPPVSLIAKGQEKEAAKSLAFYRGLRCNSKEVMEELNNIRRALNSNTNEVHTLTLMTEDQKPELQTKKMSCWQLFKTTSSIRRQFYLILVFNTATICQGLPVVQVYAEPIFTAAVGDSISPNLCSVLLGLVMLVSGAVASYLTDKVGRRPLQIYSSIMAGFCCAVIGIQILTDCFPKMIILIFMCVFAGSHTFGSGTVSYVVGAEIFLPEVKSVLLMLSQEWSLICQFCCFFIFNILVEAVGLSTVFFFFSFVCFISAVYFFYFLPETKGLSVHAIQALFHKKVKG